ncbi:hypothetical protein ACXYMX_00285 [Sporosarcina sp. CAU 1771]
MKFGEMALWTNRLKEVLLIKDSYIQRARMKNLKNDFTLAYCELLESTKDYSLIRLRFTIQQEHFRIV